MSKPSLSKFAEETLAQEVVYRGKFLTVRRDMARLPNGRSASREFVLHPGAAAMVPIGPDERILVERQYRYAMGAEYVEIPAGKLDQGETSLQTAIDKTIRAMAADGTLTTISKRWFGQSEDMASEVKKLKVWQ